MKNIYNFVALQYNALRPTVFGNCTAKFRENELTHFFEKSRENQVRDEVYVIIKNQLRSTNRHLILNLIATNNFSDESRIHHEPLT